MKIPEISELVSESHPNINNQNEYNINDPEEFIIELKKEYMN